jgi:hypothetical protein
MCARYRVVGVPVLQVDRSKIIRCCNEKKATVSNLHKGFAVVSSPLFETATLREAAEAREGWCNSNPVLKINFLLQVMYGRFAYR